jgi:hypothetical protein
VIALLWTAGAAADLSQSIANPAHRRAAQQCEASLARKGGGEVSNLVVVEFHQIGGKIVLKGTMNVLQRPASRPGEMTPTHIIAMRYSYQCRLRGGAAPRVDIAPLAG